MIHSPPDLHRDHEHEVRYGVRVRGKVNKMFRQSKYVFEGIYGRKDRSVNQSNTCQKDDRAEQGRAGQHCVMCDKLMCPPTCKKYFAESCEVSCVSELRFALGVVVQTDSCVFRIPCYVYHCE